MPTLSWASLSNNISKTLGARQGTLPVDWPQVRAAKIKNESVKEASSFSPHASYESTKWREGVSVWCQSHDPSDLLVTLNEGPQTKQLSINATCTRSISFLNVSMRDSFPTVLSHPPGEKCLNICVENSIGTLICCANVPPASVIKRETTATSQLLSVLRSAGPP